MLADETKRSGVSGGAVAGVSLQAEGQDLRPAMTSLKARLHSWAGLVYSDLASIISQLHTSSLHANTLQLAVLEPESRSSSSGASEKEVNSPSIWEKRTHVGNSGIQCI